MLSIHINFSHPWYLLLIILFAAFTIIPYFTIPKKYRKTRNRITSMVLHSIVSLLVIFILSGMTFVKTSANSSNEIILLVDVSNTENQAAKKRDDFVDTVINQCKFDNFKIGIVTFGYDQEYAVPLTRDYKNIYDNYKVASLPDTSATNIAAALLYTKDLFSNVESGKIVLITDGKETDENAKSAIKQIAATGIKIDTVNIESSYADEDEIQIIGVTLPDYHVNMNEECTIYVDIYSSYEESITIRLYDNDVCDEYGEVIAELHPGVQTISFQHTYTSQGLHELNFEITNLKDTIEENNEYISYFYLDIYNKILIMEQKNGQSEKLASILTTENEFKVDILNVYEDDLPTTVEQLCEYDEIIMNNIANADLSAEFVDILYDYVYNYGGGLFTTGGSDSSGNAHAYNRSDMIGSVYQQMLPVQAINYTPPVGVIVIIDTSGSMATKDETGNSLLDWAKAGASSCLNALTERDYFGLMTLDSDYNTILELTPRTQEAKILSAIESINEANGGTVFPGAIDRAGQALRALKDVDKKHIIIVSDGYVPESDISKYETYAKNYYDTDGITISVVGVNMTIPSGNYNIPVEEIETQTAYGKMLRLTKLTGGRLHVVPKDQNAKLVTQMREDLNAPEIKEVNFEEFYPIMTNATSTLFNGIERRSDAENSNTMTVQLEGFYGVKARASAKVILNGNFNVPLYAQWKYGKGTVGSLMVDVYGEWSSDFISDSNGQRFLKNVVANITPTENIRINNIKLVLYEDNYSNILSVYTNVSNGEKIEGRIKYNGKTLSLNEVIQDTSISNLRNNDCYVLTALSVDNNYSRTKFVIKTPGVYELEILKYDAEGKLIGSNSIFKELAYSKEYDILNENEIDYNDLLKTFASTGKGKLIEDLEDPHEIIDTFDTTLRHTFDPRYLFAIIAIICFLLDIAVRKFKFKWPHEMIKNMKKNKGER